MERMMSENGRVLDLSISRRGFVRGGVGMVGLAALGSSLLAACAPTEPEVVPEQVAIVAIPIALTSLDPPLTGSTPVSSALRHLLQRFVDLGPNGEVLPQLAESWEVASDKKTWTMHLRQGVTFHDGSDWTAEVAKINMDRYLSRPADFPRAQSYGFIDAITVLDDSTLELHTVTPNSGFLNWMSYLALGFHSAQSIDEYGDDVGLHGIGTGPFKTVEFVPSERLVMERYDNYWGTKAPLDRLTVLSVPDAAGRIAMLETGEAQLVIQVPGTMVPTVEGSGVAEISRTPSVRSVFIGINSQFPDLKDVRVRQAFNYAVDSESILSAVISGYGTLATSVMPDMIPGYSAQSPYPYDPEKAAELLDDAGWTLDSSGKRSKDGRVLSLIIRTPDGHTPGDRATCEAVQGYLSDVGVEVELSIQDYNVNFAELREDKSIETTSLNYFGYGSSIMDPTHALGVFEGSWSNLNSVFARYRSAEFDEQYKLIVSAVDDEDARNEACAKAQEIAWNDAPWIFLFSLDYVTGASTSLKGLSIQPNEFYILSEASIA